MLRLFSYDLSCFSCCFWLRYGLRWSALVVLCCSLVLGCVLYWLGMFELCCIAFGDVLVMFSCALFDLVMVIFVCHFVCVKKNDALIWFSCVRLCVGYVLVMVWVAWRCVNRFCCVGIVGDVFG